MHAKLTAVMLFDVAVHTTTAHTETCGQHYGYDVVCNNGAVCAAVRDGIKACVCDPLIIHNAKMTYSPPDLEYGYIDAHCAYLRKADLEQHRSRLMTAVHCGNVVTDVCSSV
eukprot:9135-Heterococcus_DN1.PRE.3